MEKTTHLQRLMRVIGTPASAVYQSLQPPPNLPPPKTQPQFWEVTLVAELLLHSRRLLTLRLSDIIDNAIIAIIYYRDMVFDIHDRDNLHMRREPSTRVSFFALARSRRCHRQSTELLPLEGATSKVWEHFGFPAKDGSQTRMWCTASPVESA